MADGSSACNTSVREAAANTVTGLSLAGSPALEFGLVPAAAAADDKGQQGGDGQHRENRMAGHRSVLALQIYA